MTQPNNPDNLTVEQRYQSWLECLNSAACNCWKSKALAIKENKTPG